MPGCFTGTSSHEFRSPPSRVNPSGSRPLVGRRHRFRLHFDHLGHEVDLAQVTASCDLTFTGSRSKEREVLTDNAIP